MLSYYFSKNRKELLTGSGPSHSNTAILTLVALLYGFGELLLSDGV